MRIQLWIVLGPCMVLTQTQSAEMITQEIIDEFLKANYNNMAIAEMALNTWNKEAADVDLPDWNCISQGQCCRYSQVVWRDTRTVGCAIIHYLPTETLRYLVACEYYPPGNVNGETPY